MERFKKSFEEQYVQAGLDILKYGRKIPTRTGIDCITLDHGYIFIEGGTFPMLLGKRLYPKMALKEIVWFLLGRNDVQWLRDHGVTYWDEWEIKDSKRAKELNLDDSFIGTIGKSYGYQWRNFGSTGTNQVRNLISGILHDPFGRRHIISSWCPSEYHQMALPPCVYDWNFQVLPSDLFGYENHYVLNLHAKARSIDYFLGLPYDMLQAYWFQTIIVDILNTVDTSGKVYTVGNIHFNIDNFHIYENHVDKVKEYINNAQYINKENTLTDVTYEYSPEIQVTSKMGPLSIADVYLENFDFSAIKVKHFGYNINDIPIIKADVAI